MTSRRPQLAEVVRVLRSATESHDEAWTNARFVPVAEAERTGRPMVTGARTSSWDEVPDFAGYLLMPYGVHQHALFVGYEPAAGGLAVDVSRLSRRTW